MIKVLSQTERNACRLYKDQIIAQINNSEIKSLLDINWTKATSQYETEELKSIVFGLQRQSLKKAAIKACLSIYRLWLISELSEYYNEHWDYDEPFQEYCKQLASLIEIEEQFDTKYLYSVPDNITKMQSEIEQLQNVVIKNLPIELSSQKAKEYLDRLSAYCDEDYHWIDKSQKTLMCQVAHIISGLLHIPNTRKWKPFEVLWGINGLSQAYNKRNGRVIDNDIAKLYPEYRENI